MDFQNSKKLEDIDKVDFINLFAHLQGELEAREVVINALKSEHFNNLNLRAKYGIVTNERQTLRFSEDPFCALQRDSLVSPSIVDSEAALKPLYDTQLLQLENLITSQKFAQSKMRDQLLIMEKKYLKVCEDLDEVLRKHESDAAQGDDVLAMLEKERERLKSEVEYERMQNKKLAKELKKVLICWKDQSILCAKQRMAATSLIKERKKLLCQITEARSRITEMEGNFNLTKTESKTDDAPFQSRELFPNVTLETKIVCDTQDVSHELCTKYQCHSVRKQLSAEISSRKVLEMDYARLEAEYQKVVSECRHKSPDTSIGESVDSLVNAVGADPTSDCDRLPNGDVTQLNISHRLKPNPPMRRSSEITNSVLSVPLSTTAIPSVVPTNQTTTVSNRPPERLHSPTSELCTTSNDNLSDTQSATVFSLTLSSSTSSRSSTPSPPPPPPTVQLHYPYPGLQNHLNHSSVRNHANSIPFMASNISRPLPSSVSHTVTGQASKIRPLASHQMSPSYQSQYASPIQSVMVPGRAVPSVPIPRGTTRKPTAASAQHSQYHHIQAHPSTHPASPSTQTHSKPSSITVQFSQRTCPTTCSHASISGHHFPAYSPHRSQHAANIPLLANSRPRNSLPPDQTVLSTAAPIITSGHVCVNGK